MIRRPATRGPRRRRWQELREKRRHGIFLLPSLLTTGNLFCGFFSMLLAANQQLLRRTRVQAECVGGTPRFDVDSDD